MSREYTIKLCKEDIDLIIHDILFAMDNDQKSKISSSDRWDAITELSKEKPYTNFDKIKDKMTLSDLVHINEDGVTYQDIQALDENIKVFQGEEKAKQWLESEVDNG